MMYIMKTTTATNFRKDLFNILEASARGSATQILYKKGDSIILSLRYFQNLLKRDRKTGKKLKPLVEGKILKSLDEKTDRDLAEYMGFK